MDEERIPDKFEVAVDNYERELAKRLKAEEERNELRAACAAMEKALRECRDRLRHSLTDRESCDVCRVIDAALQDTETP